MRHEQGNDGRIPGQLCLTGYVVELGQELYFKEWKNRRIYSTAVPTRAKYYQTQGEAEADIWRYLGYVGLDPYICTVCWVLVLAESIESEWQYWCGSAYRPDAGGAVRFFSYKEAWDYQRKCGIQKTSTVEIHCFRNRRVILAA